MDPYPQALELAGASRQRGYYGLALPVATVAVDLRSSTILLAGASLPRLFFDYLGQGFELGTKLIMLFVPFRLSKQFH